MAKTQAVNEQCPIELGLNILSGKWKLKILWHISKGTVRFNELQGLLDAEIPELGAGAKPAGCPVRRAAYGSFIKRSGWQQPKKPAIPALFHRHLYDCQNIPSLFLRPGVGRAHRKAIR